MAWINFDNGEGGGSIRSKLNTFLTTVDNFLTDNNKYTAIAIASLADNTSKVAQLIGSKTVLGGMKGQTAGNNIYAVTATPITLTNFALEKSVLVTISRLAGTILIPKTGEYRASFLASLSFASTATTRDVTFELYNAATLVVEGSFIKNIPRDATVDSLSFTWPFSGVSGSTYVIRVKGSIPISITLQSVSFDVESISI